MKKKNYSPRLYANIFNSQTRFRVEATVGKLIQEESDYWEHVLRLVIVVIRTLAGRGLAFRGTEERF